MPTLTVYFDENLRVLEGLPDGCADLIYIDPPFNTGKAQKRTSLRTEAAHDGDRVGFQGKRYRTVRLETKGYSDKFDDFLAFIEPRIRHAHRILKKDGSLFFHLDYREIHYCKVLIDSVFGRDSFMNEIIWAYDYGGRSKRKWPAKHDTILWYARDPEHYTFNYEEMDRIPYMAPGLVGAEKAARGKTPTDVWWHTIVSPNGKEKTGYATQKPLGIINRIVRVHSRPGDMLCDFFAGSGTLGEAAYQNGRDCILVDNNRDAIETMKQRFKGIPVEWIFP
ncbi:MAG: site-specific DNA-methyltransferase [Desulfovibrio sp.]|nr:site-specific DNA-methyltransferase [Desulfovibrio sp.]